MKTTIDQKWNGKLVKVQGVLMVGRTALEIGLAVEGQAKLLAPKDMGFLAASITTQDYNGDGSEPESPSKYGKGGSAIGNMKIAKPTNPMEVLVGTPLPYAPHMEFGTVKTDAQAFLRPALSLAKGMALTIAMKNGKYYFREFMK